MNNNRRRNFRSRSQKNNFRRRIGTLSNNTSNNFSNNGNVNFNRNGSMNNINNVEKEYGNDIPKTLIHIAVEEATGHDDFVSILISAGARPDKRNPVLETIPFHEAVR